MHAQLRMHNGAMTLFVDGVPTPCTTFKATEVPDDNVFGETVARTVRDMAERGVHVHFAPVFFDWPGPDEYDFSRVDWRVRQVLAADPQASIIIRTQAACMRPEWWMQANPDGMSRFGVGRGNEPPNAPYSTMSCPSIASDFWETAGIPALEALARHVCQQDYVDHIIGYLPTAYNSNEWFFRSYSDLQVTGMCKAMQKRFAAYLREHTGDNRDWRVPDRMDRDQGDKGYFFDPDPTRSRAPVVAYYQFMNQRTAQIIADITTRMRAVHENTQLIVGTFYGYSLGLANFYWLADSGHLALERLLAEDGPDFTCSPLEYFTRNSREPQGGGMCWSQSTATDSARVAGKAYFGEDDFCPPDVGRPIGWSCAADFDEDAELLKRNFVFTLCKGQLLWWYDLHGHWMEHPKRLETVEICTRIARQALELDRTGVSEVAVVMDEQSPWYVSLDRQLQRAMFWENFFCSFDKIGRPVDLYTLSDLKRTDLGSYKAIFFPTCFAMNDDIRSRIEALKGNGRTLVFGQAAGIIHPEHEEPISSRHVSTLSGMTVESVKALYQMRLTTGTDHPLLDGCGNTCFGTHIERPMNLRVADEQAVALGYFSGRGPVGLAVKYHDDWTSVYCGAPGMPARLVRNLAASVNAHQYTDADDIVYANHSYLGIHATAPTGPRTINLPEPKRVREAFSDTIIADTPTTSFAFDADYLHTYLFELT